MDVVPGQAKTTKKVVLRLECTVCKYKAQMPLKRCKQYVPFSFGCFSGHWPPWPPSFELGGDKKTKGAALVFVSTPANMFWMAIHGPASNRRGGSSMRCGLFPSMYSQASFYCYAHYANCEDTLVLGSPSEAVRIFILICLNVVLWEWWSDPQTKTIRTKRLH